MVPRSGVPRTISGVLFQKNDVSKSHCHASEVTQITPDSTHAHTCIWTEKVYIGIGATSGTKGTKITFRSFCYCSINHMGRRAALSKRAGILVCVCVYVYVCVCVCAFFCD
jgi:hypothetical protein